MAYWKNVHDYTRGFPPASINMIEMINMIDMIDMMDMIDRQTDRQTDR